MPKTNEKNRNAGGPDLNQYLKSPRLGSWIIVILSILLVAMFLVWAFLGNMKTTITVTGIMEDGHFTGYLKPVEIVSIQPGMKVDFGGKTAGIITSRGTFSISAGEVSEIVDNDYYLSQMVLNEYNVEIIADVDPALCPEGLITLEIVLAETRPFDFLMG